MPNIVAIVGRPNVGKSTLFNRLTKTKSAIVDERSGVTRDRNYGKADWNGIDFSVIDTGGYVTNSDDIFEEEICKQVILAIDEADVILFVVDVEIGVTEMDEVVARILRKTKKKVVLVANKADNNERSYASNEFYSLGIKSLFAVSSLSGSGTGDLLDEVVGAFQKTKEEEEPDLPKFTITGRPNVGKSSLLNALIGEDRHIVTPVAGTTRDSINTRYNKFGQDFFLIDTAGLRKRAKVTDDVEFYSSMRAIRSIENADVCLLLIDAVTGMESQDVNIFFQIVNNKKGVVILVNKWDLVEKTNNTSKLYEENLKKKIQPFDDVPVIFTSVLNKQRIHKVLETAITVFHNRTRKITTSELNDALLPVIESFPPPAVKGKYIKIKYVSQLPTHAPTFAFYCNLPQYVKESYVRFLENKLREKYNFTGVPIQIFMRKK